MSAQQTKKIIENLSSVIKNKSLFVRSFFKGMFVCVGLVTILIVWMAISTDRTKQKIQSLIPTKTAILELPQAEQALEANTPPVKLAEEKSIIALPPAPIEGFSKEENGRFLPIKNSDGITVFDAYKRPFIKKTDASIISIVVVDFGISEKISQIMINNLPADITFVLSPYGNDTSKWAAAARSFGHEFWLSLPMQTKDLNQDTGVLSLLKNAVPQQNEERYKKILAAVSGYTGFVTTPHHDFEQSGNHIKPLLDDIKNRGLGFIEINPEYTANGIKKAWGDGKLYGQNSFWIDVDLKPESLESTFISLEQKAKRDGFVIAFTRPYPSVLKRINNWAGTLDEKNLQLAPLSASIKP